MVVWTKKEFLRCSVFEWGTKNGVELRVACLSVMFSAVKSWNFVGLICLLLAGRVFENCSTDLMRELYVLAHARDCTKQGVKHLAYVHDEQTKLKADSPLNPNLLKNP